MLGRTEFSNVNHNNFNSLEGGLPSAWREFGFYPLINSPVEPDLKPANVPLNEIKGYDLKTAGPKSAAPEKKALQRTKGARETPCRSLGGVEKPAIPGPFRGPGAVESYSDQKVG